MITLVNLLYFVPIFKIICYKYKNEFKIITPGNEFLIVDEKMNILKISKGLKKFPKFKESSDNSFYPNFTRYKEKMKNNYINPYYFIAGLFSFVAFIISSIPSIFTISVNIIYYMIDTTISLFQSLFSLLKNMDYNQHMHYN